MIGERFRGTHDPTVERRGHIPRGDAKSAKPSSMRGESARCSQGSRSSLGAGGRATFFEKLCEPPLGKQLVV